MAHIAIIGTGTLAARTVGRLPTTVSVSAEESS